MITPRRTISSSVSLVRERRLPIAGQVLVQVGDVVTFDTPVLKTEMKGDLVIIRLSEKLGIEPEFLKEHLLIAVGDRITAGQKIFYKQAFISYFNITETAKTSGVVEFISDTNGHIGVRLDSTTLEVKAFVPGEVVEVGGNRSVKVKSTVGLLQGAIGYGGEVSGLVYYVESEFLDSRVLEQLPTFASPTIVVGGKSFSQEFFNESKDKNIVGIVTSSIESHQVSSVLETSVFGTSPVYKQENPVVIILEGFGTIDLSAQAKDFFAYAHGKMSSLNGLTQVRAGAIRPELLVHEPSSQEGTQELLHTYPKVGDTMRIVRGKHFGTMGKIIRLPEKLYKLESGVETHVAELDISGQVVCVSLANIESM